MEARIFQTAKSNAIDSASTIVYSLKTAMFCFSDEAMQVSRDKNLQIERNRTLNRFFYLQQNHVLQEIQNGNALQPMP